MQVLIPFLLLSKINHSSDYSIAVYSRLIPMTTATRIVPTLSNIPFVSLVSNSDNSNSDSITHVHCPNCGHIAERHHLHSEKLVRTQCADCDYLMITCSETGNVIEAYAPGITMPQVLVQAS
jgi:predicted RNA-binding Zn-ribbon protein involved in translation (DUF1610 family)